MPDINVVTVVGARPQFIKSGPVSRQFNAMGISETLVHTGQHYDLNMSEIFFRELGLSSPIACWKLVLDLTALRQAPCWRASRSCSQTYARCGAGLRGYELHPRRGPRRGKTPHSRGPRGGRIAELQPSDA